MNSEALTAFYIAFFIISVLLIILLIVYISKKQVINFFAMEQGFLIEKLQDAVFVLDSHYRVVELNSAASILIAQARQDALGKPAQDVLENWPRLATVFKDQNDILTIAQIVRDNAGRIYDVHVTPLRSHRKKSTGWVIVLHDITQLKEAEVRASRLATVIEQAQETIVITDLDGNITYANPFFEVTSGYKIPDVIGKNPNILQSGIQDDEFYRTLWETISRGESWSGNFINKRKDGTLYHEAATIFPIKDDVGETINYAAVKRDITEQVAADEAIKNFSEKLESLHKISLKLSKAKTFDELNRVAVKSWQEQLGLDRIGIWFVDLEVSNYIFGSFGIDENGNIRDERDCRIKIRDHPIHNLLHESSPFIYYDPETEIYNHKEDIIGMGETAASALWDGQKIIGYVAIDNLLSQRPITTHQRQILSLFAQTLGNLATRIRSQESIQESEKQYRLLADNASDVIWIMDLDGKFTYMSPSVEQLRGFTPEEVLQQTLDEVLAPHSYLEVEAVLDNLKQTIQEESTIRPLTLELEQNCKDGTTVLTESMISIFLDKELYELKLLGVTRNITNRKKSEREIQKYARNQALLNEITHTAIQQTDLNQMLQTLADRMGDLLGADGCNITLWDDQTQTVIPVAAYGPFRDSYRTRGQAKSNEVTLTESVLKRESVIIIDDVLSSPYLSAHIAANFPTRSGIALPLIANNKKLGAALIVFNHKRKLTENEIKIGQQAAQQIALAILKAQLLDEAKQRAIEAETLRKASSAIVTTLEQEQAIERILEELNQVVPYDSASVLLTHELEMEIVGARGFKNIDEILNLRFAVTEATPNKVVFETRKPYILDNAKEKYPAFRKPPHNHIRGWMGIPLLMRDQLIGMLTLDSQQPGRFNTDHARLASAFADQVVIALENARLFEETRRLAITDSLTDLFNRRHFIELAHREFERARRYKNPLSIIMLDIDFFKNINDTYGHLTGDQILQTTAYICRKNLRSMDIIGRYGGEEFIIMLPETPLSRPVDQKVETKDLYPLPARIVAERLRQTIAQETFEIGKNSINITVSLGVAERASSDSNIENVINHADQALLKAKNHGRNSVVIWDPEGNLA